MYTRTNRVFGTLWLLLIGSCPAYAAGRDDVLSVQVRIDGTRQLQQIDGFGSGAFGGFTLFDRGNCDWEFAKDVTYRTTREQREAMVTTAVRELGVTHLRMWISPPGIEPVNDNDDPAVMDWGKFQWEGSPAPPLGDQPRFNRSYGLKEWGDVLAVAVPLGMTDWIITPGGLPDWLVRKLRDPQDSRRFDEYAEWAAAHVLYLKKTLGLEAPYWSMHNEPDNLGFKDPAFWIDWIRATGRRFRKEGLTTAFVAAPGEDEGYPF